MKLQSVVALSLQASCKLSTQMQYSKNSKEQNCVDCTERLKKIRKWRNTLHWNKTCIEFRRDIKALTLLADSTSSGNLFCSWTTVLVLQQNRLRWYGHVLRKDDDDWVKKCMEHEVEGPRPRGWSKKTWKEVVREDCQARKLNKEDAMDRCKWRKMIKEARWSGRVWVGECFFWYRPTRVVPDQRPLNGRCMLWWFSYCLCAREWLGTKVVRVLDSGAEGPGFRSQPRRCRLTVLGKLFTPIVPLYTKQQNW